MSKITVTTIAGQTSGGDANKVKIESGDDLVVESGGIGIGTSTISTAVGGGVEIHRNGGSSFRIEDTTNSVVGELQVYSSGVNLVAQTNHPIIITPNNSEIARFTTAGLHLGGTGAANALDDYEEGTWTATLGGTSSNPTVSAYAYNSGHYTKIGRQVFAHIYMRIEAGQISGGSGDATILGLPFASKSDGSISNGAGAWIENYTYTSTSFSSGRSYARPVMVAGENRMRIYQISYSNPQQATGWALTQADDAALMFGGVMVYMTD